MQITLKMTMMMMVVVMVVMMTTTMMAMVMMNRSYVLVVTMLKVRMHIQNEGCGSDIERIASRTA